MYQDGIPQVVHEAGHLHPLSAAGTVGSAARGSATPAYALMYLLRAQKTCGAGTGEASCTAVLWTLASTALGAAGLNSRDTQEQPRPLCAGSRSGLKPDD